MGLRYCTAPPGQPHGGRGKLLGCPRTCSTAASAGGRLQGRNRRGSPGPRSWAPAPTLPGPEGRGRPPAAATCGTGLAAPGLHGQRKAGPPSGTGGDTCRTVGDEGHRGDGCSASSLSEEQSSAPCARTPGHLCVRSTRKDQEQSSQRPARRLLTGPRSAPAVTPQPAAAAAPALTDAPRKVPGMLPAPPLAASRGRARASAGRPGKCSPGASAPSPSASLHQQAGWWLSFASPCFLCLAQRLTSAFGFTTVGTSQ